ncbi:MAG: hypothetical protein HY225_02140 [Candidatus Vogelbacteria bacterium]|nr:hypothetical protein [Candidatus Vogelbacteria bacterium]
MIMIRAEKNKKVNKQNGQALLMAVVLFLFLSTTFIVGISDPILRQANITRDFLTSRKSYFAGESGIEDVIYRIKKNKQISASGTLALDGSTASVSVVSSTNTKTISVSANNSSIVRKVTSILKAGTGVSFFYGIQSGQGGFVLNNNVKINGNVFANGPILGANGVTITGSAISASSSSLGSSIDDVTVGANGIGDTAAYSVTNSTVAGGLYCQTGSHNNKTCNTSKVVPDPVGMPVSDLDITRWKNDAVLGGTINGNYTITSSTSLGPKKIVGNLVIDGKKTLTLTGVLWITGNVTMNNGASTTLSSTYGSNSGVIVTDGIVSVSNNSSFGGTGQSGTYIMVLTTSNCPISQSCNGSYAVDVSNNAGAVILNAQNGTVHLNNNATIKEVVGREVIFDPGSIVTYDSGLANENFSSGPSGGWNINSWNETQ